MYDPIEVFQVVLRTSEIRAAQTWLRVQCAIPGVGTILRANGLVQSILSWEPRPEVRGMWLESPPDRMPDPTAAPPKTDTHRK